MALSSAPLQEKKMTRAERSRKYYYKMRVLHHPMKHWIDKETMEELRNVQKETGQSYSAIIREALEWWLENRHGEPPTALHEASIRGGMHSNR